MTHRVAALILLGGLSLVACGDGRPDYCPDPDDPKVSYTGGSENDPSICERIRFLCAQGTTPFSNECGCGCMSTTAGLPSGSP